MSKDAFKSSLYECKWNDQTPPGINIVFNCCDWKDAIELVTPLLIVTPLVCWDEVLPVVLNNLFEPSDSDKFK